MDWSDTKTAPFWVCMSKVYDGSRRLYWFLDFF